MNIRQWLVAGLLAGLAGLSQAPSYGTTKVSVPEPEPEQETSRSGTSASGKILAFFLGLPMRKTLGLSRGEFVEFSTQRVHLRNAAMSLVSDSKKGEGIPDSTFLTVRNVVVDFDAWELLTKRIVKNVSVDGPQIWVSQFAPEASSPEPPPTKNKDNDSKEKGVLVRRVEVRNGLLHLDTLRDRGISIPVSFARPEPFVFENFYIGDPSQSEGGNLVRETHTDNILVNSAFGPLAPLMQIKRVTVKFSFAGLAKRRVESVVIEEPKIFVGNDWFMLADEFAKGPESAKGTKAKPAKKQPVAEKSSVKKADLEPFTLGSFQIKRLQLAMSSYGITEMELPFGFNYDVANLRMDSGGNFLLSSRLTISDRDFVIPGVMEVSGLEGDIRFNWPPQEGKQGNIVPTLKAQKLVLVETAARKRIEVTDPFVSFTLQRDSAAGGALDLSSSNMRAFLRLGTHINDGYVQGGVELNFDQDWVAWLRGDRMDLQVLNAFTAQIISGDFNASLDAKGNGLNIAEGSKLYLWRPERNASITLNLAGNLADFFDAPVADSAPPAPSDTEETPMSDKARMESVVVAQRRRSGAIQQLKNLRFIGENTQGLIEGRGSVSEDQGAKLKKLIAEENADRLRIYRLFAKREKRALDLIQREMGQRWADRAFPGEWIQEETGRWLQK
jgi:uncharacterized protein YdbL (DUF1318 family)